MTAQKYWKFSKYLIPLDRSALNLWGEPAPIQTASLHQLAERYPALVQLHELGSDLDTGEFSFPTILDGVVKSITANPHPSLRLQIAALKGFSAVGRHSCLIGPDKTLVEDLGCYIYDSDPRQSTWLSRMNPLFLRKRWLVDLRYRRQIPSAQYLPGTAALLNNPSCHNFYHWLLEVAPRLMMLRQSGLEVDHYVIDFQSRYQKRILELLGVPLDKCIQPHYGLNLRVDQFLRPSVPGLSMWQAMANAILSSLADSDASLVAKTKTALPSSMRTSLKSSSTATESGNRIYISRKDAAHRKVANEGELESMLARDGFESYSFEQIDFVEQIRLIRSSEVIVAVHGAALANLIFARPGTKIIELCPANRFNKDCFPRLSRHLGHHHLSVITPGTRFRQNLSVNVRDVATALNMLGLGQPEGLGAKCVKVA